METHLEVVNLSKQFTMHILGGKTITAFKDISFSVKKGTFLGISGKSGCGKSTMLRCIYRNYDPCSGDIFFHSDGAAHNLAKMSDWEIINIRRTKIGYVSQFFQAIPRITSMQLVSEVLIDKGFTVDEANDRVVELFRLFDISENLWDAYPSTFSGGEKQRLNLMRTLVDCPEMILLDEPTASLDARNRKIILDVFQQMKDQGITMLGVFHDKEELMALSDDIFEMKKFGSEEKEEGSTVSQNGFVFRT